VKVAVYMSHRKQHIKTEDALTMVSPTELSKERGSRMLDFIAVKKTRDLIRAEVENALRRKSEAVSDSGRPTAVFQPAEKYFCTTISTLVSWV
jgi:hypothetical protein